MRRLLAGAVADQPDHGEGAERGEAVGDEVEQDRLERGDLARVDLADALQAEDAGQQEAGVGDRGVGQHPLHVGLHDRQHGADDHGEDRDHPHHRLPGPAGAAEGDVEQPQHRTERRRLGRGRHERGHGGGGTLVDVGHPGLERRGADLEEQTDGEHPHADVEQGLVAGAVDHGLVDDAEVHRAGVAVDERDAVEEEGGGEGAEEEVLHRRFLAQQAPAPGQATQQVEREREHLESHEHGEQVTGRREEHHPADREQQQRVDLGVVEAGRLPLGLGAREGRRLAGEGGHAALDAALGEEEDTAETEDQDQAPQEHGRAVERDRALGAEQAAGGSVAETRQVVGHEADADERERPGRRR